MSYGVIIPYARGFVKGRRKNFQKVHILYGGGFVMIWLFFKFWFVELFSAKQMKVNFSGVQLRSCNHADRSDKVIDAITVFGF